MGTMMSLSVDVSVRELVNRARISQFQLASERKSNTEQLFAYAVQGLNIVFAGTFIGGPIEVRWVYLLISFFGGYLLAAVLFRLAQNQKIRIGRSFLFDED